MVGKAANFIQKRVIGSNNDKTEEKQIKKLDRPVDKNVRNFINVMMSRSNHYEL